MVHCGYLSVLNSQSNSLDDVYGSMVEITCNPGYKLNGNSTVICGVDGRWSELPNCTAVGMINSSLFRSVFNVVNYLFNRFGNCEKNCIGVKYVVLNLNDMR